MWDILWSIPYIVVYAVEKYVLHTWWFQIIYPRLWLGLHVILSLPHHRCSSGLANSSLSDRSLFALPLLQLWLGWLFLSCQASLCLTIAAALAWLSLERFCGIKVESATFLSHPILHLFTQPYSPVKNPWVDEIFCRCHQFLSNFKCKGGPPRLVWSGLPSGYVL